MSKIANRLNQTIQRARATIAQSDDSDASLLESFVKHQKASAFALVVQRHGPMVWNVCRRLLDHQDAEDAFQAAFLVLARKAAVIRPREMLANWLYGVARRTALNARAAAARRRGRETLVPDLPDLPTHATTATAEDELRSLLDEELERLADKFRAAVVLCDLEGKSRKQAAAELGIPEGTLSSRLTTAHTLLARRFARRSLALSPLALAAALPQHAASAALPSRLVAAAVRAVSIFLMGAAGEGGSLASTLLARQVIRSLSWSSLRRVATAVLSIGLLGAALVLAGQPHAEGTDPPEGAPRLNEAAARRTDDYGDPLPPGALVRMGTFRMRGSGPAALSPDGRIVATATREAMVILREAETGKELQILQLPRNGGGPRTLSFSNDGRMLAAGGCGAGTAIRLWDVPSGRVLHTFSDHQYDVVSTAFSPDGRTLLVGNRDETICWWDAATGEELRVWKGTRKNVCAVACSPDGRMLASGGFDGTVRLWNVAKGEVVHSLQGHRSVVWSIAFSPDGKTVVAGGDDKTVRLWDVAAGQEVRTFEGHRDRVWSAAFAPDGKTLATASSDKTIRLWNVATGKEVQAPIEQETIVTSVRFAADGKSLVVGGGDCCFRRFAVAGGQEIRASGGHKDELCSVAFSPDGKLLASCGDEKWMRIWDAATGKEIRVLDGRDPHIRCVAFSPDGRTLASAGWDDRVRLWNVATGTENDALPGVVRDVICVAFSSDGTMLAAGDVRGRVHLWNLADGEDPFSSVGHKERIWSVAFAPDGRTLASAGMDGTIHRWDVPTGKDLGALKGHTGEIFSLAFSPDGKLLASASWDRTVRLWDAATGAEIRVLKGPEAGFLSVAFSPDGRMLATGGQDQTLRLWELATGQEVRVLEGHRGPVRSVKFSPDGRTLASGSADTTCLIWSRGGALRPLPVAPKQQQLEAWWTQLASSNATEADDALWSLLGTPAASLPLLGKNLPPAQPTDPNRVRRWLQDLESAEFEVRQKADEELERRGEAAIEPLHELLAGRPSLETRRRAERLLEVATNVPASPYRLRELRVLTLLELLNTPPARRVLEAYARGADRALLTREAKAALARLDQHPALAP